MLYDRTADHTGVTFDYDAVYTTNYNKRGEHVSRWNKEMGKLGQFYKEVIRYRNMGGIRNTFVPSVYEDSAIPVDSNTIAFSDNQKQKWVLTINKDMSLMTPRGDNKKQAKIIGIPLHFAAKDQRGNPVGTPMLWNL